MLQKGGIEMIALNLYNEGVIQFPEMPRILASSLPSRVYLNMELVPKDRIFCVNFRDQLEDFLQNRKFDGFGLVCPVPFGGRPWIELVQSCLPTKLPSLLLDKEQIEEFCKGGRAVPTENQKEIIDSIAKKEVIVVEDVFTTGGSVAKELRFLQTCGLNPRLVIAVIDRQRSRNKDFMKLGIELFSFLKLSEILESLINIPQILSDVNRRIAKEEFSLLELSQEKEDLEKWKKHYFRSLPQF